MDIALMLTRRCNAQCTHCSTDCGPAHRQALSSSKVFELMDEAARLTPPGEQPIFRLSGGEPFLDLGQLLAIIRKGVAAGGTVSCVSNAFWASSDEKAAAVVRQVREAGLVSLAVSTSRYHQQYVKIERVRRAVAAAREAGLHTQLKIAYSAQDRQEGLVRAWSRLVGADETQKIPLVPHLRDGASLPEQHYPRRRGLPRGPCPAALLTVREDGAAYTCCTPGGYEPLLQVGNVYESPLDSIRDRFRFDPLLQVLRERGPGHLARRAIAAGHGERLRSSYSDVCELCTHIASDPVLSQCAGEGAQAYRKQWARRVARNMRRRAAASVE
jgi:hypothetical protein